MKPFETLATTAKYVASIWFSPFLFCISSQKSVNAAVKRSLAAPVPFCPPKPRRERKDRRLKFMGPERKVGISGKERMPTVEAKQGLIANVNTNPGFSVTDI